MSHDEFTAPDLLGVVADAQTAGLPHVVIGGFAVIAHGYIRTTDDTDLLVPDGPDADAAIARFLETAEATRLSDGRQLSLGDIAGAEHVRVATRNGVVDLIRGGLPPLDYATVERRSLEQPVQGQTVRFAALPSVVGFKRLAGRMQDRLDLERLADVHGPLPVEPISGLDERPDS
jgi:hypothetical protein